MKLMDDLNLCFILIVVNHDIYLKKSVIIIQFLSIKHLDKELKYIFRKGITNFDQLSLRSQEMIYSLSFIHNLKSKMAKKIQTKCFLDLERITV